MEHDGAAEEATLLDGDVARLSLLNMYLPFFTLSEEYEAMPAFVAHYALLVRNYCNLYRDWAERMSRTLESTEKLVMTERNFSKLLVVSQQLLARYDMTRQHCPETLKISKRYLDFLAADGELKKEEEITRV